MEKPEEAESKISEEFKLWKKNIPFLYDKIISRSLEYPSPSVFWFEEAEKIEDDPDGSYEQKLLFGTITASQTDNFLVLASVILPGDVEREPVDINTTREDDFGLFVYYDDALRIDFKLNHEGGITGAKHMPGQSNIVASKSNTDLFIYDIKDCLEDNDLADDTKPIHYYRGLNSRIDFEWNPNAKSLLLTSFNSNKVTIWDVESQRKKKMTPKTTLKFKSDRPNGYTMDEISIRNVGWHRFYPTIVGATSSLGEILIWDTRSRNTEQPSHQFWGHNISADQIRFSPFNEYLFITCGPDSQICIWDLRNLNTKIHTIVIKNENFRLLKWSPHFYSLFAATTNDRKIYLFDLDRVTEEQLPEEAENGPSSLIFIHGGHTSKVYDFDWNPNDEFPFMISSVSDDNIVQMWQMKTEFISESSSLY